MRDSMGCGEAAVKEDARANDIVCVQEVLTPMAQFWTNLLDPRTNYFTKISSPLTKSNRRCAAPIANEIRDSSFLDIRIE
jgi:hypothetical protein